MNQVKFLKDCFPQILFGPFLKILSHLYLDHFCDLRLRMLMKGQLGLISSMRVDDRKDIQSVKSAWSVLHTGFKAHILFLVEGNNKEYFLSPDMYTYVCVSDAQYQKGTSPFHINKRFVLFKTIYKTRSHMVLEIPLRKRNLG